MKVFISGLDTFIGGAVRRLLKADYQEKVEAAGEEELPEDEQLFITGSLEGTECPPGVTEFAPADDIDRIISLAAGANGVVLDAHKSVREATLILKNLRAAQSAMQEPTEEGEDLPKTSVVLISTLLTWAQTPKNFPETNDDDEGAKVEYLSFKEEEYIQRKPSPSFLVHKNLETQVSALSKQGFTTTVIASGILYGSSQSTLHNLFRDAWMCKPAIMPDFHNGGNNYIPMIHINDLSRAVTTAVYSPPEQRYIVAVDKAQNTLQEVVTAIHDTLQPAADGLRIATEDETHEMFVAEKSWIALQSDLKFEPGSIAELVPGDWACEDGLVANIDSIVEEFIKALDLRPLKVVVLGPPASGKTDFATRTAEHYDLPLITLEIALEEVAQEANRLSQDGATGGAALSSEAKDAEEEGKEQKDEEEGEAKQPELRKVQLLHSEVEAFNLEGKDIPQYVQHKVLRFVLNKPKCRNQGYVLDGIPETAREARRLFLEVTPEEIAQWQAEEESKEGEEKESEQEDTELNLVHLPTAIICLQADEETLKSRANLTDSKSKSVFKDRLARYNDNNPAGSTASASPVAFFERHARLETLQLDTAANDQAACFESAQLYIEQGKAPYNFHPTPEELAVQKTREEEEARVKAEEEERQKREEELQRLHEEEERIHADQVRKLQLEEEEKGLLDARSEPLRDYLLKNVMPTLSAGLVECCQVQPEDPIDYLAEYLLRHSSKN